MTDPVSGLVVCRQRLDVLEQQAKAATWDGWYDTYSLVCALGHLSAAFEDELRPEADHIAAWSPAAVLALCEWIRQTLDGAEKVLALHGVRQLTDAERQVWGVWCQECAGQGERGNGTPCPWFTQATSVIAGLAAVLAGAAA